MSTLYGSQGDTFAENAFIWASRASFTLEAPEATCAGKIHTGFFPLSSLVDKVSASSVSIAQLRQSTTNSIDIKQKTRFDLTVGVVNHSLVNTLLSKHTTDDFTFASEIVAFAIVENGFV